MTKVEAPEQSNICPLAENFYRVACSRFSRMVLIETTDAFKRTRIAFYGQERVRPPHSRVNVLPAFRELLFAFRPNVFLDLYFNRSNMEDLEQLVASCIEDINDRYGTDDHKPKIELLWADELPEAA